MPGKHRKPKEKDMKKGHLIVLGAFLAGVVLARRVRALPVLNKLPAL